MKYFLLFSFLLSSLLISAQELMMPQKIKRTYENGTRNFDGKPGSKYWKNYGRYDISITAMPPDRTIKGKETIVYVNNSPDTLHSIVIKLILNIHRPGAIRLHNVPDTYLTDGLQIDDFSVNGRKQQHNFEEWTGTWQEVELDQPLYPNDSMKFDFTWHYKVSLQSGREGMLDSTTFYLAYFYPRIAVYDDYNGWDKMDFTDRQEFYNDFNDYNITVTVPKNYVVWATGELQNTFEVLQPAFAAKLLDSYLSDNVISIANFTDIQNKNITTQNETNTWKWKADYVSDVTLCLSDHYVWDAASVIVDPVTKRRASVQSAYNDTARDFHSMVRFGQHALSWFSKNWPGVPYPYPKSTIVQGYADMEYPMMVNDASVSDTIFARFVAEHEIAHTWFPFYMGINETRYGFMDEGWATTLEYLIGIEDIGKKMADEFYRQFRVGPWTRDGSANAIIPIITPGDALTGPALSYNQYGKAALGYLAMKDLLGDDLFKKCLHAYMADWNGKHPIPWDFFFSFNTTSGKNLNWFWNAWFFQPGKIDFAIEITKKNNGGYDVTVKNYGGFPAPVDIVATYADGKTERFHQTPAIWQQSMSSAKVNIKTGKNIKSISLDGGIFMDSNPSDNSMEVK